MARDKIPFAQEAGYPWSGSAEEVHKSITATLPCEAAAVAVWSTLSPKLDELLVSFNIDAQNVIRWADPGFFSSSLNRQALTSGYASGKPGDEPAFAGLGHVMIQAWPHSLSENRWWWLLLSRKDRPFNPREERVAQLILQNWVTRFDQPAEAYLGRVLLGHDNRMLCADLRTRATLLAEPAAFDGMLGDLKTIVAQRFPDLGAGETRDFVAEIGGRPHWVVVSHSQAAAQAGSENWYLELRPLQADELPAIGSIEDERIARAIAYLHANYHKSPSLAQIARAVHTSPFHFHRLFTREVGVSPKQYLQRRQLQVAKWMLRATREPIGAIAGETGFASHGHFTSTFHRVVGLSPSDYREKAVVNGSSN